MTGWRARAGLWTGLLAVVLAACGESTERVGDAPPTVEPQTPTEARLWQRAESALEALAAHDMAALAELIHPTEGVRLSPYAYVDVDSDRRFLPDELLAAWRNDPLLDWGIEDGTGEPLTLRCSDYFDRFVYDVDFMNAEAKAIGERLGHGNTIDNAAKVYPEAKIVEYHFSGFDPKYQGLDWKSLRLAFEPFESDWHLVGLIHDQWTT